MGGRVCASCAPLEKRVHDVPPGSCRCVLWSDGLAAHARLPFVLWCCVCCLIPTRHCLPNRYWFVVDTEIHNRGNSVSAFGRLVVACFSVVSRPAVFVPVQLRFDRFPLRVSYIFILMAAHFVVLLFALLNVR